jgi:threonine dehydrogenase-like Zn-dependent dehydrogenase
LLTTWIEICASDVAQTYGQGQLDKVMQSIVKQGVGEVGEDGRYRGMVKGDSTAAVQRLGAAAGGWKVRGAPEGRDWA